MESAGGLYYVVGWTGKETVVQRRQEYMGKDPISKMGEPRFPLTPSFCFMIQASPLAYFLDRRGLGGTIGSPYKNKYY
jgi:hypothetical protein